MMDINLISLYQDDLTRKCLSLAGYTCLVFDHTLTIDKEVEFIWKAPWTFTKAVFLLNRYMNLICQTVVQFIQLTGLANNTAESCERFAIFAGTFWTFSVESIHILVLLRAWALWRCDRRVATMLIGSYSVYLLFYLIQVIFNVTALHARMFKYPDHPQICLVVIPSKMWFLSLAHGCQDTVFFVITMVSLWRYSKNSRYLYPTSLLFLLVRDAVIFYIASIFFAIFNGVTWTVNGSNPKTALSLTFALNLLSIAGQRLVLNLRGFKVRTYGSRSLSAEVDRQLQLLTGTQVEWWSSSTNQSDSSRVGTRRKTAGDIDMDGFEP